MAAGTDGPLFHVVHEDGDEEDLEEEETREMAMRIAGEEAADKQAEAWAASKAGRVIARKDNFK